MLLCRRLIARLVLSSVSPIMMSSVCLRVCVRGRRGGCWCILGDYFTEDYWRLLICVRSAYILAHDYVELSHHRATLFSSQGYNCHTVCTSITSISLFQHCLGSVVAVLELAVGQVVQKCGCLAGSVASSHAFCWWRAL